MAIETDARRSRRQVLMAAVRSPGRTVRSAPWAGRHATERRRHRQCPAGPWHGRHGQRFGDRDTGQQRAAGGVAFSGVAGAGTGLYGYSATGLAGVRALGGDTATGVFAQSTHGTAVSGASTRDDTERRQFRERGPQDRRDRVGRRCHRDRDEHRRDRRVRLRGPLAILIAVRGRSHRRRRCFGSSDTRLRRVSGPGTSACYGPAAASAG